ncbi:MAG: TetR family transcriptional regulator [Bacteroidetes bacterium]|nr:TetR family transcriptional regulator [Bacteroidota bacterium]
MARIKAVGTGSKKDTITKKAAALFRKKGFASTSMRELADNIGVEAASLYNHIGSKNELLQTICFTIANAFTIQLEKVAGTTASNISKLESLIRFHIQMMLRSYDEVFVANHEWKQLQEPFLTNFLSQRKNYENALVGIVQDGIKKNELKKLDPYVVVLTLLSAVRGLEFWQRHKKNLDATKLENDMVNHLIKGLIK